MSAPVRLSILSASDETEFLAAVRRSGKLHGTWTAPPTDAAAFHTMLESAGGTASRALVVRHAASGELAGYIHISNIIRGPFLSAFLGYYVFSGFERQGLMRAGLGLAVRMAFNEMKLHRLEANIQPGNVASIALVRACGFQLEGYSPRYLKIAGRWRDHERWAILAR